MTAEEFERWYVSQDKRANVHEAEVDRRVAELRAHGRIVVPCGCGSPLCPGWQSTTLERLNDNAAFHNEEPWNEERIKAAIAEAEARQAHDPYPVAGSVEEQRAWHGRNDDR